MKLHSLGQFEVNSGEIIISDPCYDAEGQGLPAIKGTWNAYMLKATLQTGWGEDNRCAFLFAHLASAPVEYDDAVWLPLETGTGVDSGQAGIFDAKFYRNESVVTETIENPLTGENRWYDLCCSRTLSEVGAGTIPYGCVSSSGWGDGFYPAFGVYKGKQLVAIALHFQVVFGLMPAMSGFEKNIAKLMKDNNLKLLPKFVNQALADTAHKSFDAEGFVPDLAITQPSYAHFNDLFFVRAAQYTKKQDFLCYFIENLPNAGQFLDIEFFIDNKQVELLSKIQKFIPTIDNMGVLNALFYLRDEEVALQLSKVLVEIGINPNPASRFNWEEPFIFKLFNNNDFQPALAEFWLKQGVNPNATHEEKTVWQHTTLADTQLELLSKYTDLGELKPVKKSTRGRKKKAENVTEPAQENNVAEQNAEVELANDEKLRFSEFVNTELANQELAAQKVAQELDKLKQEVSDILQEIIISPKSKKAKKGKKSKKDPKAKGKKAKKDPKAKGKKAKKDPKAKGKKAKKDLKTKGKKSNSKNLKKYPKKVLLKKGNFKNMEAKVLDSDGKFYLVEIDLFGTAHQQEVRIKNTEILKK